jgi:hypothetical protein
MCSGSCVDTSSDANNCGGCGMACTGSETCSGGVCSSTMTSTAPPQGSCSHSLCSSGTSLTTSCSACAKSVCAGDSYCCNTSKSWDAQCVTEVATYCNPYTC